jgi:tellurite resistance protein TehA-like permease
MALRPTSLMVVRLLLVSNGLVLAVVGGISLAYVDRPAGLIGAGIFWLAAAILFGCVRRTDPYRPGHW